MFVVGFVFSTPFELENNKEQTLDPYKRVVHGGLREHGATFMA